MVFGKVRKMRNRVTFLRVGVHRITVYLKHKILFCRENAFEKPNYTVVQNPCAHARHNRNRCLCSSAAQSVVKLKDPFRRRCFTSA